MTKTGMKSRIIADPMPIRGDAPQTAEGIGLIVAKRLGVSGVDKAALAALRGFGFPVSPEVGTARGADGLWWVLGQRTQAPSGLGYALENRQVTIRAAEMIANWPSSTPTLIPSSPTTSEEVESSRVDMTPAKPSP
mgnify:CR=1 FL=1